MIQIWQHCDCVNVKASEAEREDLRYRCEVCDPRPVEKVRIDHQVDLFTAHSNQHFTMALYHQYCCLVLWKDGVLVYCTLMLAVYKPR